MLSSPPPAILQAFVLALILVFAPVCTHACRCRLVSDAGPMLPPLPDIDLAALPKIQPDDHVSLSEFEQLLDLKPEKDLRFAKGSIDKIDGFLKSCRQISSISSFSISAFY